MLGTLRANKTQSCSNVFELKKNQGHHTHSFPSLSAFLSAKQPATNLAWERTSPRRNNTRDPLHPVAEATRRGRGQHGARATSRSVAPRRHQGAAARETEKAGLSGGLEVLAAGGDGHGLHLALLYAERAVHLGPAGDRRVLEVGPVVGATGLGAGAGAGLPVGVDGTGGTTGCGWTSVRHFVQAKWSTNVPYTYAHGTSQPLHGATFSPP